MNWAEWARQIAGHWEPGYEATMAHMSGEKRFDSRVPITLTGRSGFAIWFVLFVVGWIILGDNERRFFYVFFITWYWGLLAIFELSERPWRFTTRADFERSQSQQVVRNDRSAPIRADDEDTDAL
jgi:hypothetical protein